MTFLRFLAQGIMQKNWTVDILMSDCRDFYHEKKKCVSSVLSCMLTEGVWGAKMSLEWTLSFQRQNVLYQHRISNASNVLLTSEVYFHCTVCWVFIDLHIYTHEFFSWILLCQRYPQTFKIISYSKQIKAGCPL